jgi:hypothetical protein
MKDSLAAKRIQLCATSKSNAGINFVDLRSVNGLMAQRFNPARWLHNSLHPNALGHAAMLDTLDTWISRHPGITAAGRMPAEVAEGVVTEPDPPCSMTVTDNLSCQQEALDWELGELRSRAWWAVGSVLLGFLLLWAVTVVIVGRVRGLRRSSRPQP